MVIDLTGQKINGGTVLEQSGSNYYGKIWKIQCDCGEIFDRNYQDVKRSYNGCKKCAINYRYGDNTQFENINFTVVERYHKDKRAVWKCLCNCGNEFYCESYNIKSRKYGCKTCKENRDTVGEIRQGYFHNIELSAKDRNIDFNITKEYIWELFLKQNRKCVYTNDELYLRYYPKPNAYLGSLDRIDSKVGYIEKNVQWVKAEINIMKMDMSECDFLDNISKIYAHRIIT